VAPNRPPPPDSDSGADSSAFSHVTQNLGHLRQARPARYFRECAELGRQIASALAYAHSRGIIHRDVKPANVMLDETGTALVCDFGLARGEETQLTRTGAFVGTLRYMSPERFRGECDARADVYALGAVLYEFLTLSPAMPAKDEASLLDDIVHREPIPPRRLDRRIPRDLETIVLHALTKDPRHRYGTASAMRDDLQRFLDGRPIRARKLRPDERFVRWARRNPGIALSVGTLFVLLVVGTVVATLAAREFGRQARVQTRLREAADEAAARLRRNLYMAEMRVCFDVLSSYGGAAQARRLLDRWVPAGGDEDARGAEWDFLDALSRREEHVVELGGKFEGLSWHPSEPLVAVSGLGRLVLVDASDGTIRDEFVVRGMGEEVAFSADGHRLAVGRGGGIQIFDPESGRSFVLPVPADLAALRHTYPALAWHPSKPHLAAHTDQGFVLLYDVARRELMARCKAAKGTVRRIAFDPEGRLLIGNGGRATTFWDGETLEKIRTLDGSSAVLATHPSGLLARGRGPDVTVVRSDSGKVLSRLSTGPSDAWDLDWHPSGRRLATGGGDGVVRVHDVTSGLAYRALSGHDGIAICVRYRPDGSLLAAVGGTNESTLRLWSEADPRTDLLAPNVFSMAWHPTEDALMFDSARETLITWDDAGVATGVGMPAGRHRAFSPDGSMYATNLGRDVLLHDAEGAIVDRIQPAPGYPNGIAWHPDENVILTAHTMEGQIALIQVGDVLRAKAFPPMHYGVYGAVFSPDGEEIFVSNHAGVAVVDPATGALKRELLWGAPGGARRVVFSPDGKTMAVCGVRSDVILVDPLTLEVKLTLAGHSQQVTGVCWHPTAPRIVTGSHDGTVRFWDFHDGTTLGALRMDDRVQDVAFSPSGRRLAVQHKPLVSVFTASPLPATADR
jgi:WD40 repeat protein